MSTTNKSVSSLRRNIIFGFIGQTGLLFLSLISTRLIFKQLGADVLGIINFAVVGTFFLISLADMGITPTIAREVAAHRNNDSEYVSNLISTMSLFSCLAFVVCSLIAVFLSPVAVKTWLKIETVNQSSAVLALQIISVALLLAIPRSIYGAFMNGFQRLDFWNISNLIYFGLQQLGMIIVLSLGGELLQVAVWYLISAFVGLIPYIVVSSRLIGWRRLIPKYYQGIFSRNLKFGSVIFANSILGYFLTQMDRWTISKFLPVSQLGYYGFAQGLVSKGAIVPGAIANAAFPALSQSISENDKTLWVSQYNKLQDFCCYLYVPVAAAVTMIGSVVIAYVFNLEIARLMLFPLIFLSLGQLFFGALTVPSWLAIAMKKPEILVKTNLVALFIVVPVSIVLTYKFGLRGAAFSTIIYGVWQFIYFVPKFCKQCLQTNAKIWYIRSVLFISIGVVVYSLIWFLAFTVGAAFTVKGLIASYFLGTIIFVVAGWFLLGEETKAALIRMYKDIISKLIIKKNV